MCICIFFICISAFFTFITTICVFMFIKKNYNTSYTIYSYHFLMYFFNEMNGNLKKKLDAYHRFCRNLPNNIRKM